LENSHLEDQRGLCPMASFGISSTDSQGSATRLVVTKQFLRFQCQFISAL